MVQKRQKMNERSFCKDYFWFSIIAEFFLHINRAHMARPKHLLATKKHLQYCMFVSASNQIKLFSIVVLNRSDQNFYIFSNFISLNFIKS